MLLLQFQGGENELTDKVKQQRRHQHDAAVYGQLESDHEPAGWTQV